MLSREFREEDKEVGEGEEESRQGRVGSIWAEDEEEAAESERDEQVAEREEQGDWGWEEMEEEQVGIVNGGDKEIPVIDI